jgi:hypothetical protein
MRRQDFSIARKQGTVTGGIGLMALAVYDVIRGVGELLHRSLTATRMRRRLKSS